MAVKYSLIIPSYNGGDYLKACVSSVLMQINDNYELIISDDHSVDGTKLYLESIRNDPRVKVISPSERLSMTEHWEWALTHASGEWLIFIGQDDAVQPYFFTLADKLTDIASDLGIRSIMSERAYFFWPGCEAVYGDVAFSYTAKPKVKVLNSALEATKSLLGFVDYFELPQMYTTSLFHKTLLDDARDLQNGQVFSCHPQDANLAAIACSLESQYLKSYIPLGWVGSSPKSAGMAVAVSENAAGNTSALRELKIDYEEKIKKSKLKYNSRAGDFGLADLSVYFWQALIETPELRSSRINSILCSRVFGVFFFALLLVRNWRPNSKRNEMLANVVRANGLNFLTLIPVCIFMVLLYPVYKSYIFFYRVFRKLGSIFFREEKVFLRKNRSEFPALLPEDASREILSVIPHFLKRVNK